MENNGLVHPNEIGLEVSSKDQTIDLINQLLADYQVYFQNLRGFHWNIQGPNFFTLHEKFEELYGEASDNIDMIAERVLILGGVPLHSLEEYVAHSNIDSLTHVTTDREAVSSIKANNQVLIADLRKLIEAASQQGDEGTADMATEVLRSLEKNVWMLGAYLR